MEWLLVLAAGIVIGSVFTWIASSLRNSWKRSKDLRSSVVKTRKEQKEKALKVKADSDRARREVFSFAMKVVLLVLSGLFVAWLFWFFVFQY